MSNAVVRTTPQKRRGIFYGWWVLGAATASQSLNSGLFFNGFGVFFLPILGEFGVGRAAISGAISLSRVQTGILGPFEGWLVDRFGPRRIMLIGAAVMGVGFLLLAHVGNVLAFYIVFVFALALGASFGFGPPPGAAVANWFRRRRGFAFGVYLSGTGVGAVAVPLVTLLVDKWGWREAAVVLAFVVWVLGVPLALMMRHRPEQYGMLPDGEVAPQPGEKARPSLADEPEFTLGAAVRTRAFWFMGLSIAMRAFVFSSLGVHLIAAVQDRGFSAAQAGFIVALVGVTSIAGRLLTGYLGDRLDNRLMASGGLVVFGISTLIFANAGAYWMIVLFAVLFGPSDGGFLSNYFAMRGQYFGRKAFATIGGALSVVQVVGSIIGPLCTGLIFDVKHTYTPAFYIFTACLMVGSVLILMARPPSPPRQATP